MTRRTTAAALLFTAASATFATACGSDDDGSEKPSVAASTGIVADITDQIGGEDIDVVQVIPDGASPHDFQLSARDRAGIEDSALLVTNGASLEQGIPVDEIDVENFALADNVPNLLAFEEQAEGEEERGGEDPHVWMDPIRVAAAVPALAGALAEADPDNAGAYHERAKEFTAQLETIDGELEQAFTAIPPGQRNLVTSHDALGYLADRYGFEVVATPFPTSGPDSEPSAQAIVEVEDAIRESGVPTVFATEEDDPEVLRQIADHTGVEIVEDLLVESPGSAGSYVEMLRRDAELISQGLAPAEGGG